MGTASGGTGSRRSSTHAHAHAHAHANAHAYAHALLRVPTTSPLMQGLGRCPGAKAARAASAFVELGLNAVVHERANSLDGFGIIGVAVGHDRGERVQRDLRRLRNERAISPECDGQVVPAIAKERATQKWITPD